MKEILLINPGRKPGTKKRKRKRQAPKSGAKKGVVKIMARRRRRIKRNEPNPNPRRRRVSRKRNPFAARARTYGGRAVSRARGAFAGLDFKGAVKHAPYQLLGMFAAKWAAKRFGGDENAATETDPESWNYASYLKGGIGAAVGAILANMVRPGMGQKVLEGGVNLMLFKLVENELIPKSEWATTQFGEDEEQGQEEPLIFDEAGTPYMLGEEGYIPVDERHRLPEEVMGSTLEPVGPLGFGSTLEPVGPLGEDPWADAYLGADSESDPFKKAFL